MEFQTRTSDGKLLFASITSTAIASTFLAPLERLKVLLQTQKLSKISQKHKVDGLFRGLSKINLEQGLLAFWRGNGTNVSKIVINRLIHNLVLLKSYKGSVPKEELLAKRDFVQANLIASYVALIMTYPLDAIRMRLTADCSLKVEANRLFNNFFDCLKKTLKVEGVKGLYRGFVFTNMAYVPCQFTTYSIFLYLNRFLSSNDNQLLNGLVNYFGTFAVSSLAGMVLTHPLDTIRRRLQLNGAIGHEKAYTGVFNCIKNMYSSEGLKGFYAGLTPSIIRLFPGRALELFILINTLFFIENTI